MTTCAFAWIAVLLLLPLVLIWNLTESKPTKVLRAHQRGHSWQTIAQRYKISPQTAGKWAKAEKLRLRHA
jgi:hypothetical protein